jgi:hypothetical protein
MRLVVMLCAPAVLWALASCAASGDPSGSDPGSGPGGGGAGASGGVGASSGGDGGSGNGLSMGGSGGYAEGEAEVYGHSDDTLYKLDPITKELFVVGAFDGCDGVIDLAIDKSGGVIATSFSGLYAIDKTTAVCTEIALGNYPNSLSFVPQGTLDPNAEALVGYNVTDYVRIDPVTGQVTTVNAGAIAGGFESSGDIVSVIGGGTYLTIKGAGCNDCLVEVNPVTGAILNNYGGLGQSQIFGLAYWGGSAYGFTNGGTLFEISFDMGGGVSVTPIAIPGAPAGLGFWGAGSSTSAPIIPPAD